MSRILVIHPQRGFLEMVRRVLTGAHEVDVFDRYEPAIKRLNSEPPYDAVLCSLNELGLTTEIFERASESTDARLIPIASNLAQAASFCERWDSDVSHKGNKGEIGIAWLPERCTAGEILALFRPPAQRPVLEAGAVGVEKEQHNLILTSGTIIDGYRLVCIIGKGGFGTTWLAVNEATNKQVALKFVEGEEQVNQELAALRRYVHVADRNEHLIPIEHVNRDGFRLWFVTPLADSLTGGDTAGAYKPLSLENRLQAVGHLVEREAVRIAICMVRALTTLHEAGLLHGDVSPSNILSRHGRWVLADPGLVRFLGEHGICRNRTYYPPPKVDRASHDLYAVGVLVWEMVSGVWEMVSGKERLRLEGSMLNFISKDLPTGKIIGRAVSENVEQRYMTAGEMLRDLESLAVKLARKSSVQDSLYTKLRPLRTSQAAP